MTTKRIVSLAAAFVMTGPAWGADTNILKKDGTTQVAKSIRRQGDSILATVDMAGKPGASGASGEIGIPIAQIQKIDFPEPTALKNVPELMVRGKAEDALQVVEPVYRFYEGFRDAPGSWWCDLALLKMNALIAVGREKEADALADTMARPNVDPEAQRTGKVIIAASLVRRGNSKSAIEILDKVLKESTKDEVLASAAIYKGNGHLELKEWDSALLCFLQIPVLYPEQKALLPLSLLGVGRSHFGMENFAAAKEALNELIKTYEANPAAASAKVELEAIAKREKVLAQPK